MKKLFPVLLSVILTASMMSAAVYAQDDEYTENGVRYKLLGGKTASVVGCDDDISQITVPDVLENGYNVESIESEAFQGNLDLESVVINADITSVGDYAFESCAHLKTAAFKGSVASVGSCAFSCCASLTAVELPNSVSTIGDGAFLMDKELASFNFPSGLASVGEYAFAFSGIQSADMSCPLDAIPDRLFYQCVSLSSAALPDSVKTIGNYAFGGCENLSLSSVPESVDIIGSSAFSGTLISNIHLNCSQIGDHAFSSCYELQSVEFSDNLKMIGSEAFANATVEVFTIPDNAKLEAGALARLNTSGFEVSETNGNYTAENGILFSKDKKTLIAYPCSDDSENSVYTVPDGVEVIAPHAFDTAWTITEIKLPDTVTEIGECAFYQSGLQKITLPDSVKTIGEGTFEYCQSLENVDLGKAETIEKFAFKNAGDFKLKIPESVSEIDPLAFAASDVKLEADGDFKTADGVLFGDGGKTLVYYPQYLESEVYSIPDGVENIAENAFVANASVKQLNIPASLVSIGEYGVGYKAEFDNGSEQKTLTDGFLMIGDASEGVKGYARDNNIGVFSSGDLSQNITEATLAGKETVQLVINNTDPADVVYTSNDEKIASVSQNGTVTGLSKGVTYVTAAVGMTYFKCKVTVTSDSGIEYDGFDDSKYLKVDQDSYKAWVDDYRAYNPYITQNFKDANSSPAVSAYQSQSYFQAMFGADAPDSHYYGDGTAMFGEGYDDMIKAISHACDAELSRYKDPDDMVLYSGADNYTTGLVTHGQPATVQNMRSAVGTSFTYPLFTSTTLDEIVSHNFYGGSDGVLMMIYADKKALEQQHAGYIGAYHGDIEYELLISHGARFEVIDAGVRYVSKEGFREDDEKLDTYERYVKLKLLYDETDIDTDSDKPKSSDTDKSSSTKSQKPTSSVQAKTVSSQKASSTSSQKSSSLTSSKNTSSQKSSSITSSKNTSSQKETSSKSLRNIFTGDATSYTAIILVMVLSAAAAAALFRRKND